jgi:uncharacterized protein YndB with AHSA1/START domain
MNEPRQTQLVLERTLNAPRELVFQTWIDPVHLAQWWGPKGFTTPVCEVDARPGGTIRIHLQAPDGTLIPTEGVFQEILEPERIVFTNSAFKDDHGEAQLETQYTVTFAEMAGKTNLTVHALVTKAGPSVAGSLSSMESGWKESLDRLAALVDETVSGGALNRTM